ncbi:MFS transporter [Rhodococcus sp. NPDC057014]|uniref:MFS transporter n=1 Tax=unclassified Rhodococcus (in: high G+C Gram-positive bacteria) TaxID=192944 RepID=UPI00363E6D17
MSTEKRAVFRGGGSWSVIAVCFAILMTEGYDLAMFGSVVPSLRDYEAWSLTPAMIGYMGSASVIGMLCGALSAAGLADRIGRRPVIIAAVATFSAAMGLSAFAPNPEIFLVLRFFVGLGAGAVMPTVAATLIEFAPADRRNRNTALGFIGVGVGGMLSGALAIWLVPTFGFRAMCLVGALPLVLVLPFLLRYLPESIALLAAKGRTAEAEELARRHQLPLPQTLTTAESVEEPIEARRNRFALVFGDGRGIGTVLFWIATFFCLLVTFGVSTWLPDLMRSAGYGLTASLGFLIALKGGAVVGVLAAAQLADKFGQKVVVTTTFITAGAALVALALTPPVVVAYLLVAVVGLGTTGLQTLINAFVGTYYPARVRSTGLGLNLSVGRVGGILGPMYLGWLVAAGLGFDAKFYALAVPALIGGVVISMVPKPRTSAYPTTPGTKSASSIPAVDVTR